MMDKNLKKRKDAINSSSSNRSTPASSASLASKAFTKSADNTSRASSSQSLTSGSNSINESLTDTGPDVTKPEIVTGYNLRAHLQQIMMFSDDEDDDDLSSSEDDYSIESFDEKDDRDDELSKLATEGPEEGLTRTPLPTGMNNCQSLVPISEEESEGIDSEEEKELMKEIRNEITNNVRQEMKSELALYQAKMQKLENSAGGEQSSGGTGGLYPDLENLDPKLRSAIIKMRKLDKILTKKVRREKAVKRDRILLERRMRREIEELHKEKKDEYKEVLNNEHKFLALELPSRHNEEYPILSYDTATEFGNTSEMCSEIILAEESTDVRVASRSPTMSLKGSPCLSEIYLDLADILDEKQGQGVTVPDEFTGEEVFATQLNEDDYPGLHPRKSRKAHSRSTHRSKGDSQRTGSEDERSRGNASSLASDSTEGRTHRKNKNKDFIKRNKELAADAGNAIAMTDEEKNRLDDLLKDMDSISEIPEDLELDDNNPFQLAVRPGEGFLPDHDELRSLTSIDSRLRDLMPPEDYQSIASSSMSHLPQNMLFTHTAVKHTIDWEHRGEKALFQNAEQREMNERMLVIDDELARLKNPEENEFETATLDEDQLQDLIEQCVTSLSQTSLSRMTLNSDSRTSFADTESIISHSIDDTVDNTPRSPRSARQELLDNPPRLAPDVLQKLLSEAYHPLSKQLSTLQEAEDEEEDYETTPIPSEVWKLIAMEKVDENQCLDTVTESIDAHVDVFESYNRLTSKADMGSTNHSARNGFRTLSQNSTASTLASVSDLGTGREIREEPLKLPEIDPSGSLVTQGLNNNRRTGSSARSTPVNVVRNSFSDSSMEYMGPSDSRLELVSLDGDISSPYPLRRDGSGNKSRTAVELTSLDGDIISPYPPRRDGSGIKSRNPALELTSLDGDIISPHPPSRERREGSGSKSRMVTPASRSTIT